MRGGALQLLQDHHLHLEDLFGADGRLHLHSTPLIRRWGRGGRGEGAVTESYDSINTIQIPLCILGKYETQTSINHLSHTQCVLHLVPKAMCSSATVTYCVH